MTLGISYPRQGYKAGMNGIPSTYGSGTISSGDPSVTIDCGWLKGDSVVRIFQNAAGASGDQMQIIEAKYDASGDLQRRTGPNGQFVVSTVDGSNVPGDLTFDWLVTEF